MHIKKLHEMVEELTACAKKEVDKGIECLDADEMGKMADIIKDLCEAEYYAKISKAMDESEYGEDYDWQGAYDDGRRGYRGQPRDSRGRYKSRRMGYDEPMRYFMTPEMYREREPEYWRDMDRKEGRMYYTETGNTANMGTSGGTRHYGGNGMESRYEQARRGYEEAKEMHKDNNPEAKQHKMKELENYMKELSTDVTNMIADASKEEKDMLKNKMQVLMQKIQ